MQTFRRRAEELVMTYGKRPPHLFVGGLDLESDSHTSSPVREPATQDLIGRCPSASAADVDRAVKAARACQPEYRDAATEQRRDAMARVARFVESEAEDLMILHAMETGRTVRHVRKHDVEGAVACLRYHAGWATKLSGEYLAPGGLTGTLSFRAPTVTGVVVDDREPFSALVRAVVPALAVGSAVVAVVSETAPFTALRLAEFVHEAGLPSGSLNVLPGQAAAAEALASHPEVDLLIGSVPLERARRFMVLSAKSNLKPVRCETGGRSSAIVFEDASLTRACRVAVRQGLGTPGLDGWGLQRLYVQRSVYEEVATAVTQQARSLVQGDPLDEHSETGAVPHETWMKRTLAYVQLGRREGAKVVAGGSRNVEGSAADGFFVSPTVFVEGRPGQRVVEEDTGGPLLILIPFDGEREVLQMVNRSVQDPAVSVWTQHAERLQRVTRRLEHGVVWQNGHGGFHPGLCRSGRNLTGDHRMGGRAGLEALCSPRTVVVPEPETETDRA